MKRNKLKFKRKHNRLKANCNKLKICRNSCNRLQLKTNCNKLRFKIKINKIKCKMSCNKHKIKLKRLKINNNKHKINCNKLKIQCNRLKVNFNKLKSQVNRPRKKDLNKWSKVMIRMIRTCACCIKNLWKLFVLSTYRKYVSNVQSLGSTKDINSKAFNKFNRKTTLSITNFWPFMTKKQ